VQNSQPVKWKKQGLTDVRILEHHPDLTLADLAAAWDYYATHHAVVTFNRRHFIRLHTEISAHAGIVVCTRDNDMAALADRIHRQLQSTPTL
jgi:Protein of unknown function (DUF433)